jgi:uncharacterized protein (DUF362 family)/Pyruvate/2-oxoacid:ferredoxin oxidoreductase delta subunit
MIKTRRLRSKMLKDESQGNTIRIKRSDIYKVREADATWDNNLNWENDAPWDNLRPRSKVAVIPCYSYEQDEVDVAVRKGIEAIGGLHKFIGDDEKILFKPNLLTRAEENKAVTTNPAVFEAVIKIFKEDGYKNLAYGDSPGYPGNIEKTAKICGLSQVAEDHGIPMADFNSGTVVEYESGRLIRKYDICNGVLESDAIVDICKMKTHQLETITGAVKNLFGCVHGLSKSAAHAKFPDAQSFAQMLIELNLILKPRLHIMDGVIAMEGNGPASGTPTYMNVLLFSDDPVALDATFCRLVDLDVNTIPTVYYGDKLNLGNKHEQDIEIILPEDVKFEDLVRNDFDVSRSKESERLLWRLIKHLKLVSKRPVIDKSKCIKCGVCVETCPLDEKAVVFPGERKDYCPEYDYDLCIKCYCCQEMCPEGAITARVGFGK